MKSKGLLVFFIIIVFLLVSGFSVFSAFLIKEVEIDFKVSSHAESYIEETQKEVNKYKNTSLLFLNEEKVKDTISKYTYLEVLSIEKKYPDKLDISIKEREEAYFINYNDSKYILDKSGFVVNKDESNNKNLIEIKGVKVKNVSVGSFIEVEESVLFSTAIKTVSLDSYTNNVSYIEINKGIDREDIVYKMTTGVEITVTKAENKGEEKINLGFSCYDNDLSDYDKYKEYVLVFEKDDGMLQVTHSSQI